MNRDNWITLATANIPLLEGIYAEYEHNPQGVSGSWQHLFREIEATAVAPSAGVPISREAPANLRVYHLIQSYRTYGHLMAKINPIATHPLAEPWQLKLETLGFSADELDTLFPTCGLLEEPMAPLRAIIDTLKTIYCDKIGIEYMGLQSPQMEQWIQQQIEPTRFRIALTIEQKQMILTQLNRSELLESFIQVRYTGQKRFSLEGAETLVPMLEAFIEAGSKLGMEECVIGMTHRGRLNVISNILNKSHRELFAEFEENYIPETFEGSGDVKYHKGFSAVVSVGERKVKVELSPNPSHLESVDAVVEGQVRARQVALNDEQQQKRAVPILVHGDAALSGQGVLYETLQFYRLPGYATGGTIHFVINNQIGFTTTPEESRSTQYCTDIARAFDAPVFHVNAEDPEGCIYATLLATQLRQKFHCDVFIDLNCYRKYGHNEADEPAYTQPLEYQLIRKKRPIRELYRDQLIKQGVVEQHIAETLEEEYTQGLQKAMEEMKAIKPKPPTEMKKETSEPAFVPIETGVAEHTLRAIAERLSVVPTGFNIHAKLQHLLQERLAMVAKGPQAKPFDWGMAELLAYGSLLWEGFPIRLSGQDSRRGTFSHRHAIWVDQVEEEKKFCPLNNLKVGQAHFDVYNSPLSEYAALGFEFGYSYASPHALVIWEAQFGDFANGAQVVIDQYLAPSEQKWGQKVGLTLFLPHGYEGQGPEHSSGRIERFLSLCGNQNMRVVNPTTPAQFFHLLRNQMLRPQRKPLIVFTPKALLRSPVSISSLDDFTQGYFQAVIDDPTYDPTSEKEVKRVVLCSGKVYYDLVTARQERKVSDMAIIRVEQLYPVPSDQLQALLKKYPHSQEWIWAQEEPRNMGAWTFMHEMLRTLLPSGISLRSVARPRSASPAVGSYTLHKQQHQDLLSALFESKKDKS